MAEVILADAPPTFALCGHSMGGYVGFELLRHAPERVRALALVNTSARPDTPEQRQARLDATHLNRVYFEKRRFSSSGSRLSLTQRRSAVTRGSRSRRTSRAATRRIRSSALAWQW